MCNAATATILDFKTRSLTSYVTHFAQQEIKLANLNQLFFNSRFSKTA